MRRQASEEVAQARSLSLRTLVSIAPFRHPERRLPERRISRGPPRAYDGGWLSTACRSARRKILNRAPEKWRAEQGPSLGAAAAPISPFQGEKGTGERPRVVPLSRELRKLVRQSARKTARDLSTSLKMTEKASAFWGLNTIGRAVRRALGQWRRQNQRGRPALLNLICSSRQIASRLPLGFARGDKQGPVTHRFFLCHIVWQGPSRCATWPGISALSTANAGQDL